MSNIVSDTNALNEFGYDFISFNLNPIISNYIETLFTQYATKLTNNLIAKMNIDSFCSNGVCYYSRCKNYKCELQLCKYFLVTGKKECMFDNKSKNFRAIKNVLKGDNMENNEVNIYK